MLFRTTIIADMGNTNDVKIPLDTKTENNQSVVERSARHREKVAVLLTSEPNFDEYAFKYFILSLNSIQSTYEFVFPEINSYFYTEDLYKEKALFKSFTDARTGIKFEEQPDYFINVIQSKIAGSLFFTCDGNIAFITTDLWEKMFSPPSLFEYLLHCIGASLIFMHSELDLSAHTETRGCTLDYTRYKMDDKVDIILGYLCDGCTKAISDGAGPSYLQDLSIIIGRDWIGDISTFDSVAHNLKRFFKFDINKDSGFNKTFWERAKQHFEEIPMKSLMVAISLIIGAVITLLITQVFG